MILNCPNYLEQRASWAGTKFYSLPLFLSTGSHGSSSLRFSFHSFRSLHILFFYSFNAMACQRIILSFRSFLALFSFSTRLLCHVKKQTKNENETIQLFSKQSLAFIHKGLQHVYYYPPSRNFHFYTIRNYHQDARNLRPNQSIE